MRLLRMFLALALIAMPVGVGANDATDTATDTAVDPLAAVGPFAAAEVALADQLYLRRPVVVFADTPANPDYQRQLTLIERGLADLAERDVIVILDPESADPSEWRLKLRPRGFSLVVLDKDQRVVVRKPNPWDVREISRAIDKLPSRRDEVSERYPGR